MGIIKIDDIIAWEDGEMILCDDCADVNEDMPIIASEVSEEDPIVCDNCQKRIIYNC